MNFDEYQEATSKTAIYPDQGGPLGLAYAALGVANEAGEVAGKVKKCLRGDYDLIELQKVIKGEIGDTLYYLARVAEETGISLDECAESNLSKLADRAARGVIQGNGDER